MNHLDQAVAFMFLSPAALFFWAAYQINCNGRTDLVRFGSGTLPGAGLLKSQFAWVALLQGLASAAVGGAILLFGNLGPAVWVYGLVSAALSVRRGLLVRSIEIHSVAQRREA